MWFTLNTARHLLGVEFKYSQLFDTCWQVLNICPEDEFSVSFYIL
jgi:hypothetical protein